MGSGSKVVSVFLRVFELISAAVVAGLVGEYLHYVSDAHAHAEPRLVYTVSLAGISLVVCLVCMIPLNFAFYGFLLDFMIFIMWMTSFGLLVNVSGCL
jgi:Membrane-associating domain